MRLLALALLMLSLSGCSTGIIVHDQVRAAELIVDFLSSLKSAPGIALAYDWTGDKYQEAVSFNEFSRMVSSIRQRNRGADIELIGYEVFGAKESMIVYAHSAGDAGETFFKFALFGSKTRDYHLVGLNTSNTVFSKSGIYRKYGRTIIVRGV